MPRAALAVLLVALILLAGSAFASTTVPGYIEIEKPRQGIIVRVPVAIESSGAPPQGEYQEPAEPASGIKVTILFPPDGLESLQGNITAHGRAWSKDTITKVEYRVNGGAWQLASGTTTWTTAPIQLSEGWNTIEVRARDSKGRVATARVRVKYTSEALQQGEWRVYRVPFPIKFHGYGSQAVFYTDTGFKIVIKAENDGASYRKHTRDPLTNPLHLYVYDPQGRLYADTITYSVGQGKGVPGKLDFSYEVWDADYAPDYTLYFFEIWDSASTPKISYSEDDGGWLHIRNLKVWLYEPKNLQRSYSITKSLVHCSYDDEDWGVFTGLYQVYSIGNIKKSCYFQHPVITGKLVLYGDKEAPQVVQQFYKATPFVYAKTLERDYIYDYCWSGELIYGDKKTCPRDRYRTIYHQTFTPTQVTKDNVVLRVTDDSGYKRTTRLETYRRKKNEIDGWKSIKDAFSAPSPAVTVYVRKQGGSWVTASRYTFEYPYNVHYETGTRYNDYFDDRSIIVGTEYFYASAKSLGLTPGWNTIEAKAVDWTGRESGVVTVGKIYYDPKPPWAVWIKPNPKTYFRDNFEDGKLDGWSFSGGSWGATPAKKYEGQYSARSPWLRRGAGSCMYKTVNVGKNSVISFVWTSNGYGYTYSRFYVDGKLKAARDNAFSWTEVTVPLSKGSHTIKWCYSKSRSAYGPWWNYYLWVDDIKITEAISTPVFDVSARIRDDWGIAKVEAMVEETAEIEANGKKVSAGEWLTLASFSRPKGKTDITIKFKVYSLGGKHERVHIRITDEAGNVREYVRDYYIDAPPYARLTYPKHLSTAGPEANGIIKGEAFWSANKPVKKCYSWGYCSGYTGSPVLVRVNKGKWLSASPGKAVKGSCVYTCYYYYWDAWKVLPNQVLFHPGWNTVEIKVKDTLGREAVYTYKVYYSEPNTITWNFDSGDYSAWTIAGFTKKARSPPYAAQGKDTYYDSYGFKFYLDGALQHSYGAGGWRKSGSVTLSAGIHTLKWGIWRCGRPGCGLTKVAEVRIGLTKPYRLTYWFAKGTYTWYSGGERYFYNYGRLDDIVMTATK